MHATIEFWILVVTSLAVPIALIAILIKTTLISRRKLIASALVLLALACVDLIFLQRLMGIVRRLPSSAQNAFFLTEMSVAVYILPLISAGAGINLLTFSITQHLRIKSGD